MAFEPISIAAYFLISNKRFFLWFRNSINVVFPFKLSNARQIQFDDLQVGT